MENNNKHTTNVGTLGPSVRNSLMTFNQNVPLEGVGMLGSSIRSIRLVLEKTIVLTKFQNTYYNIQAYKLFLYLCLNKKKTYVKKQIICFNSSNSP